MPKHFTSVDGLFGQKIHYDENGNYVGESWPGLFEGSMEHYDANGQYAGGGFIDLSKLADAVRFYGAVPTAGLALSLAAAAVYRLMKNKNENLRKLSFIVLILILHNNENLQNIFCEKYNFNPIGNVICLNWLPSIFKEKVNLDENLINELKKNANLGNSNSNTKYWKFPNNKKYTDEIIPDPERYLLGFFYSSKNGIFSAKDNNNNNENNVNVKEIIKNIEDGYKESNLEFFVDKEKNNVKKNKKNSKIKSKKK